MNIYDVLASKPHSDFHLRRYWAFVSSRIGRHIDVTTERHHICPKAKDLFPEYRSLVKFPWNAIDLTPREHYLAHMMLMKAYGGSQVQAFVLMGGRTGNNKSRLYEKAKLARSNDMKINNPNADGALSKAVWANASEERREQQRQIAKRNGIARSLPKGKISAICKFCQCTFHRDGFVGRPLPVSHCSKKCSTSTSRLHRTELVKQPKTPKKCIRTTSVEQKSAIVAETNRKNAAKLSETAKGRTRLYLPDGSWTWQYPTKQ